MSMPKIMRTMTSNIVLSRFYAKVFSCSDLLRLTLLSKLCAFAPTQPLLIGLYGAIRSYSQPRRQWVLCGFAAYFSTAGSSFPADMPRVLCSSPYLLCLHKPPFTRVLVYLESTPSHLGVAHPCPYPP